MTLFYSLEPLLSARPLLGARVGGEQEDPVPVLRELRVKGSTQAGSELRGWAVLAEALGARSDVREERSLHISVESLPSSQPSSAIQK